MSFIPGLLSAIVGLVGTNAQNHAATQNATNAQNNAYGRIASNTSGAQAALSGLPQSPIVGAQPITGPPQVGGGTIGGGTIGGGTIGANGQPGPGAPGMPGGGTSGLPPQLQQIIAQLLGSGGGAAAANPMRSPGGVHTPVPGGAASPLPVGPAAPASPTPAQPPGGSAPPWMRFGSPATRSPMAPTTGVGL